ncbi:development-specific protein LVN1.2-like [Diadema antillarum]|uniref:development-specific protein LVN1.2-like n=1 Tax=Diadema antillarum TaxID=105358 RepID=UPI003A860B6A
MDMKLLIAMCLVAGAAMVSADPPIPCCAPKQMTFIYGEVVTTQTGDVPMAIARQALEGAIDFTNAVTGYYVNQDPVNGTEVKFRLVQNFTAGFQWLIEGSHCLKMSLTNVSPPVQCIPDSAIYQGSFAFGLEKLKVNAWRIDSSRAGVFQGTQDYTSTDYMCIPFSSTVIGQDFTTSYPTTLVSSGGYTNVTTTISDPDRWFKLPSSCNNSMEGNGVTFRRLHQRPWFPWPFF